MRGSGWGRAAHRRFGRSELTAVGRWLHDRDRDADAASLYVLARPRRDGRVISASPAAPQEVRDGRATLFYRTRYVRTGSAFLPYEVRANWPLSWAFPPYEVRANWPLGPGGPPAPPGGPSRFPLRVIR